MGENQKILIMENVNSFYGKSHILFNVSIEVKKKGEIVALMGRNGAGKTTLLKSIMGWVKPESGSIIFKKKEIIGKKPFEVAREGIGIVPDECRLFSKLTVLENLDIGELMNKKPKDNSLWNKDRIFSLFPALKEFSNRISGNLSGGQRKMLALSRTLLMNPDLILVDEPTEGLAPILVDNIKEQLFQLKSHGVTMIIVEQTRLNFLFGLADRAYIIDKGEIKYEGSTMSIKENDELKRRYLGI